nr:MAG: ORF1 [TTV-like mini virus]
MPYFWRKRPYWWRRHLWRRRTRAPFRWRYGRKRWRRRRYRVRKLKLPFLRLKQWQPRRVKKLKITGMLPTYITTHATISNDLRLYEDEIVPHLVPSMGGYSITTFTLSALYQLYQKGRCYWTESNTELPLIRYTGCEFKLYRAESSDAIYVYQNCFPMTVTANTFNSTQPTLMSLTKNHKIIRCKKHNYTKKPYRKLKIKPPSQFSNKWYTQKDIADLPLVMLLCSAMSLDRTFMASNSQSTTMGFWSLNTDVFKFHDWEQQTTQGYRPADGLYFYSFQQGTEKLPEIKNIQVQNIIFLGASEKKTAGQTIKDSKVGSDSFSQTWDRYFSSHGYWGNIFVKFYLTGTAPILYTTQHPKSFKSKFTDYTTPLTEDFKYFDKPLIIRQRYNPLADLGGTNNIYLLDLHDLNAGWDPDRDKTLQRPNLPLWLGAWGLIDWWKLSKNALTIDTEKVIAIQTQYFYPHLKYSVPLDEDFIAGYSPYRKDVTTASDNLHWHPKTLFQHQTINNICAAGPGTIKLPSNTSAEGHIGFSFYFKIGGCAQDIKEIEDPEQQPDIPTPNNILTPTSLQSPKTSLENFIYSFDWRRGYLTDKAIQRIKQSEAIETSSLTPTGINLFNQIPPPERPPETDSSEEEKENEALQCLLNLFQHRQKQYRHRIIKLMEALK